MAGSVGRAVPAGGSEPTGGSPPGCSRLPATGCPSRRSSSSADQIHRRVAALAAEIDATYAPDATIHVVGVLRGAFLFTADLVRALRHPVTVDFARLVSYPRGTVADGPPRWRLTPEPVRGRHVLIVEDIVDTGHTLETLRAHLADQAPASLRTVSLLDKPERRRTSVPVEFVGFTIDDVFVVGYGLDLDERHREWPDLRVAAAPAEVENT